uniref:COX assembly mitochondrial protein n=1 Tax=Cacopsylla melanoneura TaxID=428564 RepID=A0A8D8LW75_9HEMI
MPEDRPERPSRNLGPHGLGDPDDRFLRKIEKDVLVEKMMRDIARTEKCVELTEELEKCGREHGWKGVFNCRDQNNKMKECMGYWYKNDTFRQEVTELYLKERSNYRKTGLTKQMKQELEKQGYEVNIR